MSTAYDGVGMSLPTIDVLGTGTPVVEVARAAEQAGLDHVWSPDHLLFHRPVLEAVTTLSVVAGATSRVRLGFAILNPVLRHPVWIAKQIATLAVLSGERLLLGVGAGGEYEPEFRAAGVPTAERGKRLDAFLDALPAMLRGDQVGSRENRLSDLDGIAPVPSSPPPLLVGGRSAAALRRAARTGDAWFPMWMSPQDIAQRAEHLAELASGLGRPAPGIALVAFCNVGSERALLREQAATFIRNQYGMPFEKVERWTLLGDVEHVAEQIAAYRQAGVSGFCLCPAHPVPLEQVEALAAIREALAVAA